MELIRCHAEGFGVLSDRTFDFSEGLNALHLQNGEGKSTLCAFLKCMLYGLSESRSRDLADNERKHYTPWQGGRFGGTLILRHRGHTYRICRSFGARPSEDRMQVFDEQTGEATQALGPCPGEAMLGMDAEGFASCAIFSERGFRQSLENESILSLLGGEDDEQGGSLTEALSRLSSARKLYEKRGGRGLLCETESEISELTRKQLMHLKTAEELSQREAALLAAKAALSALAEGGSKMHTQARADGEKRKKGVLHRLALLLGLLSFSVFSVLGLLKSPLFFAGLPFSAALLFLSLFGKKENNSSHNDGFFDQNSKTALDTSEKKRETLFEECYQRCTACERAYEQALEAKENVDYLALKIEELEKKCKGFSEKLSDIKKTEELLSLAGRKYRESRTDVVRESFCAHLCALGEASGERFRLGDRFTPSVLQDGGYREAEALSRGEQDRVSFSRSLSLLSAMPKEKRPPLLLDDPFLSYDDRRLPHALAALTALSREYQIVYLTCSKSRMP